MTTSDVVICLSEPWTFDPLRKRRRIAEPQSIGFWTCDLVWMRPRKKDRYWQDVDLLSQFHLRANSHPCASWRMRSLPLGVRSTLVWY